MRGDKKAEHVSNLFCSELARKGGKWSCRFRDEAPARVSPGVHRNSPTIPCVRRCIMGLPPGLLGFSAKV